MEKRNYVAFFALILTFQLVTSAYAQGDKQSQLDQLFRNSNEHGVFNGNVLIVENNKILLNSSYGFANATGKEKLDPNYRFNIGSIAKEFNAVGIMMLKEKGELSLSDKLSKYLSDLPKWADSITVLNLLQYTSGIPNSRWKEIKSDADNYAFLKKVEKLDFVPGTKYAYNNNNVFLQRQIIESISGISFNEFVKQNMLTPLKMSASIIDPKVSDAKIALAFSNAKVHDDITPPISGWTSVTTTDFLKWANAITNYKLINPASTREILNGFAPGNQAGLGSGTMVGNTLKYHIHDGTARNYQALLVTSKQPDRVIILLTNNQQNNLRAFNRSITSILDGKPYAPVRPSFLNAFKEEISKMDAPQFFAFYEETKKNKNDQFSFESEDTLTDVGYHYLNTGKLNDALLIFQKNVTLFPTSANAFDSLGELYLKLGDKDKALVNYRKSFELDEHNYTAKRIIGELTSTKK